MDAKKYKVQGEYISDKMKAMNLTGKMIAEETGVSEPMVSKWKSGESFPKSSNLEKLAAVLAVSPYEIQHGHDASPEEKTRIYEELKSLQKENDDLSDEIRQLKDDNAKALHRINEVEARGTDTSDTVNLVLGTVLIVMALAFLPQMNAQGHLLAVLSLIVSFFLGIIVFFYGFVMFLKHQFPRERKRKS